MGQLSFQYPDYYLLACLALAILSALLLYYKGKSLQDRPEWQRFLLALIRGFSIFLLALLLMNPILKRYINDVKKPQLAIVYDKSFSMMSKDSSWMPVFDKSLEQFKSQLSDKYQIEQYNFGSSTTQLDLPISMRKRTNIDDALLTIADHSNAQLLKGVVLITDGIFNSGKNPYYNGLCQLTPIFTVFHGDSSQEKDLVIQRVYHNDIIYSGDKFSIQADLQAWNVSGENTIFTIEKFENNLWKRVFQNTINIESNAFFKSIESIEDASSPGIYKYRAFCNSISGERNIKNNSQSFFVEVLDARKKVLLYAQSPHPDLAAIKNALESNKNYEISIVFAGQNIIHPEKYDLVVFHQLPSITTNIKVLLTTLNSSRISRIFCVGPATNLNEYNASQDLLKINGSGANPNESQAVLNPMFNNFTLGESLKKNISIYPPVNSPFGTYDSDPTASILAYQRIGKIDTKYPLILFQDRNGVKTSIICGEGIWKWRFNEYLQSNNFDAFDELISKCIQFTTTKEDKRKFRAIPNKKILSETDELVFNAELYNDNYERINTPDVNLQLRSEDKKTYDFTLGKKENYYESKIGNLPPGDYTYIAKTVWNEKSLISEGKIAIHLDDIELNNLVARPDLLRGISEKSGARSYQKNELSSLAEFLNKEEQNKPILFQSIDFKQFIDFRWILFIVLLLLTTEWFLRRFWGSY